MFPRAKGRSQKLNQFKLIRSMVCVSLVWRIGRGQLIKHMDIAYIILPLLLIWSFLLLCGSTDLVCR